MGILRAIGFVVVLIAIRTLMPDVFFGFENALVQFFHTVDVVLAQGAHFQGADAGNFIPAMNPPLPSSM